MKLVSVLVPAHNEGETIRTLIEEISQVLSQYEALIEPGCFEIVVLDDGSTDNTLDQIQSSSSTIDLIFIRNEFPSGIASAFWDLYARARGQWLLLIPGDYQWRSDSVTAILDAFFRHNCESAISTRRISKVDYTRFRKLISFLFSIAGRIALGTTLPIDPGSIKMVPSRIQSRCQYTSSPAHEIERLILASLVTKNPILLIDVAVFPRLSGKSSSGGFQLSLSSCKEVFKIISRYTFRRGFPYEIRYE